MRELAGPRAGEHPVVPIACDVSDDVSVWQAERAVLDGGVHELRPRPR